MTSPLTTTTTTSSHYHSFTPKLTINPNMASYSLIASANAPASQTSTLATMTDRSIVQISHPPYDQAYAHLTLSPLGRVARSSFTTASLSSTPMGSSVNHSLSPVQEEAD